MRLDHDECLRRASHADHGILATVHATRGVDAVPVCFALDTDRVVVPVDREKPKRTSSLQRVENLRGDPRATLLCEHWDGEDWERLWWVRLSLRTEHLAAPDRDEMTTGLRLKYPQYRTARFHSVLVFRVVEAAGWAATAGA